MYERPGWRNLLCFMKIESQQGQSFHFKIWFKCYTRRTLQQMGHKPYFLLQSDMLAMKRLKVINASYYSMNIFGI